MQEQQTQRAEGKRIFWVKNRVVTTVLTQIKRQDDAKWRGKPCACKMSTTGQQNVHVATV